MMPFLSFCFFLLIVWIVLFFCVGGRDKDFSFFSKDHTDIMRGYAIMGVMLAHVGQYSNINGIEFLGSVGVAIFLVLSGYGVATSVAKNGLNKYWQKRFLRVYLPFAVSDCIAILLQHRHPSFLQLVLNYALIKEIFVFIWYFRFIFVCYLAFYLIRRFIPEKNRIAALYLFSAVWFVIRSTVYVDETPFLLPRQMLCFPVGVSIAEWMRKNKDPYSVYTKAPGINKFRVLGKPAMLIVGGTLIYGILHTKLGGGTLLARDFV